jgi:hypothetical protein
LSDRVEPRIVASAGMGLCAIGLMLFALLTPETSSLLVVAGLVFMGPGFALFSSPDTNAIMALLCVIGVILSLARGNLRSKALTPAAALQAIRKT